MENETELMQSWHAQDGGMFHFSAAELRARSLSMDQKSRRITVDFAIVFVLASLVLLSMAMLEPSVMQIAGAMLSSAALAFLVKEVRTLRVAGESGHDDGLRTAIEHHRAQLQRQLAFAEPQRVWRRMAILAPGPMLFLGGFAAAHPQLATLMYLQIVTFLFALGLMPPLARRSRHELAANLVELDRLTVP